MVSSFFLFFLNRRLLKSSLRYNFAVAAKFDFSINMESMKSVDFIYRHSWKIQSFLYVEYWSLWKDVKYPMAIAVLSFFVMW